MTRRPKPQRVQGTLDLLVRPAMTAECRVNIRFSMSLNLRKPIIRKYKQARHARLSIRGKLGVAMRNRKRIEALGPMRPCGGFVTFGCLGHHRVQLLAWPEDVRAVAVVVDGNHRQPRTFGGLVRCMAEMISSHCQMNYRS